MKNIIGSIAIVISVLFFLSCSREDRFAKKLYRHEGRWTIDYASWRLFDSTGIVISDSTIHSAGEIVLFKSGSLEALYDYHQAIFLLTDTAGTHGFPFEYMFDGKRISIKDCNAVFDINGTYTSVVDKANEKQWEIYSTNGNTNAISSMTSKFILHLIRSKN